MKNVNDLRNELITVFDQLKRKKLSHATAKELTNTAGKIISSTKLQLEYASIRKERPEIPFLNVTSAK